MHPTHPRPPPPHSPGKGAFGIVRVAKDRRTGEVRACKSISKARLVSSADVADMRREVEILHLLTPHPTLAGLATVYEDRHNIHLIMDHCAGGELFDRVVKKGSFSEAEAARYLRRMVEMVHHCHSCGVIHRDIKPENFLLSDESDAAELLGCDFGLSVYYRPGQAFSSLVGSAYYVAPEVLRKHYGPEADIWSLGVVLFILLSGLPPFWGPTEKDIFVEVLKGKLDFSRAPWPKISEEAKDLVSRILTVDPAKRITTTDMLNPPWLRDQGIAPSEFVLGGEEQAGRRRHAFSRLFSFLFLTILLTLSHTLYCIAAAPLDSVVITRMKQFSSMTKMFKAAVLTASRHLSHEEIHGLRELFKSYDTNGTLERVLKRWRRRMHVLCSESNNNKSSFSYILKLANFSTAAAAATHLQGTAGSPWTSSARGCGPAAPPCPRRRSRR